MSVRIYQPADGPPFSTPVDPDRCAAAVMPSWVFWSHQCWRPRGHGPDGLYCRQHGKMAEVTP